MIKQFGDFATTKAVTEEEHYLKMVTSARFSMRR